MDRPVIWDPLRKKQVALTPEEEVRQWFINRLNILMKVPMHMMMSETGFSLGDKKFRADIVIYGRDARPVTVVECKRPDTDIDGNVLDQVIRYNMVLNVKYIIITNGRKTFIAKRNGDGPGYGFIPDMPLYGDMTDEG